VSHVPTSPAAPATKAQRANQRKSTLGAFVGTAIEWYDFYIFGTASALVFGKLFFPVLSPGVALLASFATFWVGFLARPIGGFIFSHFGDKLGRKNTLLVTLVMMGSATFLIGCLPTYQSIGVWAPVLLVVLRAIQGLSVGGEWGGAVVLATENSAEGKKGMAGAWVQQGSPAGSIIATLVFLAVGSLPDAQFLSWGWRVPFLITVVLLFVAFLIRRSVEESEQFKEVQEAGEVAKVPFLEAFRVAPLLIVFGVLGSALGIGLAYFNNTFLLSWTTGLLDMPRTLVLNLILLSAIAQFIWQPIAALLAPKVGGTHIAMIAGLVLNIVLAVPFFMAIQSANGVFLGLMLVINVIGGTGYYSLLASALAEAFPPRIRYTGVSVAYQLCATIFGGSTPVIGQWVLNASGGSPWAVMAFYIALTAVTLMGVIGLLVLSRQPIRTQKGSKA
jgi:MFS family permease